MYNVINKIISKYTGKNYKPKRRKKKRGYIEISGSGYKDLALVGILMAVGLCALMALTNFIFTGTISDIKGHLIIIATPGLFLVPIYLYYCFKKVWFNDNEIIATRFLRKNKVYKYEDIIKVTDIKKHKIIIHTIKGKIKVDHELHNSKKILAKLEEKNIPIREIMFFEKMFPNAKI